MNHNSSDLIDSLLEAQKLFMVGKVNEAKLLYEKIIAENPSNPDVLSSYGTFKIATGHLEDGLDSLKK